MQLKNIPVEMWKSLGQRFTSDLRDAQGISRFDPIPQGEIYSSLLNLDLFSIPIEDQLKDFVW